MENEQILADLADRFETWKQKKDGEIRELREGLDTMAKHASRPGGAGTSGAAMVTPEEREHREAFANWLRNPRHEKARGELSALETRTASTLTDTSGGYAVPSLVEGPLMMRARDANPLRGIVRAVAVSTGDVTFPLSNADAGSGWVGETDTRAGTGEPTLTGAKPTFGTLYALVEASEELVSDMQFDVQGWFTAEAGAALGAAEMAAIVSGNGTNKPTGFLNTAPEAGADGTRTQGALKFITSGAAAALSDADKLIDVVYDLQAKHRTNARWVMNSRTAGIVRKLKDGDARYLWAESLAPGQPPVLLGYPVTIAEGMPDVAADDFPIAFGDFAAAYVLADRGGLRTTVDDNISQPGRVRWYVRKRVGGTVYDNDAVRLIKIAA